MTNAELLELGVADLARAVARGDVDPRDTIDALDGWLQQGGERTGAFVALDLDRARRDLAAAPAGPLRGVPLAIKDILHVDGFPTTCGSRILAGYQPPFEAHAVAGLRQAGAVFFGKLNMDEFAMGSSNETSAWGPVRNPWDLDRAPGGSSGGSAAAVAARQTAGTLGTDTGGSIRQPAAFCGITGLKPTYGAVSRRGVIAFASSLDQVGPMARSAEDCAWLYSAIAGHDPLDATSAPHTPPPVEALLREPARNLRIGLPREYFDGEGLSAEVRTAVSALADWLTARGAEVMPIDLPHTRFSTAVYYLIATAEASSNLARFDGIRYGHRAAAVRGLADTYAHSRGEGFGTEVKRRIMLGVFALSSGYYDAYYGKAQRVRTRIREDFEAAFAKVDLILTPTSPTTAFRLGERLADPLQMYLSDVYTNACNLAGIPGIGFPCGFDAAGLPIGAQLMAPAYREDLLLGTVHAYQQDTDWHRQRPPLVREGLPL
jgi:aspartyl-tRNA(Asn)/glutamyl-tRNA(Gln) amidotransferase subunit A